MEKNERGNDTEGGWVGARERENEGGGENAGGGIGGGGGGVSARKWLCSGSGRWIV